MYIFVIFQNTFEISAPPGTKIGSIRYTYQLITSQLKVYNANDQQVFEIDLLAERDWTKRIYKVNLLGFLVHQKIKIYIRIMI